MKNLLYIIPLLLNQASALDHMSSVSFSENDNQLTITINYTEQEHTNAYNNYEVTYDDRAPDVIKGTQKFGTTSTLEQTQANIKKYDYCNMTFHGRLYANPTIAEYQMEDFCIIEITPYRGIEDTTGVLSLSAYIPIYSAQSYDYGGLSFGKVYQTHQDLSSLLNLDNWTTMSAVRDYYSTANSLAGADRQSLYDDDPWITQDVVNNGTYMITINDVEIQRNETTYIYCWFYYTGIYNLNSYGDRTEPNESSKYFHVKTATFYATKIYTPPIEIVDIPGLMFTILGMPFTFISQAFDLTLFQGTPYAVNISKVFLGLIAVAMLFWVLKLVLGRADLGGWLEDQKYNAQQARHDNRSFKRAVKRREKQKARTTKLNEKHNEKINK